MSEHIRVSEDVANNSGHCYDEHGYRDRIVFEPGTLVRAVSFLGGYTGAVLMPEDTFDGSFEGSNIRFMTRIRVTDPGDGHRPWETGQVVDVITDFLTAVTS